MTELAFCTATELVARFRGRQLSPVEATTAVLERIDRHDRSVGAYCLVDADQALDRARTSERRWLDGQPAGLLDGVPVAIKDVFLTRGWATRKGSRLVDPAGAWNEDAPVVGALARHGAVAVGKTTTPELGWKGVTDNPLGDVARNPWDTDRTAGGSSGGSAAAVAMGMGPLALGTDGGGSIRIPAAFCGVAGLKPTYGRVPLWPPSPFGTLAHAGPMAWTVRDLALMLTVLAEPDSRDWTAEAPVGRDYRATLDGGVDGLRVAFSADLGYVAVDPEVADAVERAAATFADLGAHVEHADPGFADPLETFNRLWYAGAAHALRDVDADARALLDPGLAEVAEAGAALTALDYLAAVGARNGLGVAMSRFHTTYDLLLTPTVPIPAFGASREVPDGWPHRRWQTWTPFTYPFNLTQQPAATVPCGFTRSGLPIGLQIVAAKHADELVLRAAHAYQAAAPLVDRRPGDPSTPKGA